MSELTLTSCQEEAVDNIQGWLLAPKDKYHILSGCPGVGKSFVVDHIGDQLQATGQMAKILDTSCASEMVKGATTNKAARNITGETVHSIFGLRPKKNFNTGKLTYIPSNRTKVLSNTLLVVDECSMEDTPLMNIIDEFTDDTCKILKVGDRFQLAPVKESKSPVFHQGWSGSDMVTPVRQDKDSDLFASCTLLREMVRTNTEHPMLLNSQVSVIDDDQMSEFLAESRPNDRLIGFDNDFTVRLNQAARESRGIEDEVWVPGEVLVSNGIVMINKKVILTNEEEVTVVQANTHITDNVCGVECYMLETSECNVMVPFSNDEYRSQVKSLKAKKNWQAYYELIETVADLRGAHTCTATKSQGSTYGSVAINMNNLRKARYAISQEQYLRMLYVATSRAKEQVYLYGY